MSLRRKRSERLPERKHPGDPEEFWCSPGSIEQQLDMCEEGSLRGDAISHRMKFEMDEGDLDPIELDSIADANYGVDLAEPDREGAEMSGDEHSMGMQGDVPSRTHEEEEIPLHPETRPTIRDTIRDSFRSRLGRK